MSAIVEAEINRYVSLPYTTELIPEGDGTWFARVSELPGCMTVGETREEAMAVLDDAMRAWIVDAVESGHAVPEPYANREFSGKFVVRVAPELHRDLVRREFCLVERHINFSWIGRIDKVSTNL